MKDATICFVIALLTFILGAAAITPPLTEFTEKKLGTAICKKLSGTYARLDGDPVCINPAGGILKFYD